MLKVNSSFALGRNNAVISGEIKQKTGISFGRTPVSIPKNDIPKDINIAREAIIVLSHHLQPLAELTQQATTLVPKGQRAAFILGELFNKKTTISPCVDNCFKQQERHMVQSGQMPASFIQEFRQNYNTLCGFVRDYGQRLKVHH